MANPFQSVIDGFRGMDVERALGLRPAPPRIAVELERHQIHLVRLKRRRGGRPLLESHVTRTLDKPCAPSSIFDGASGSAVELSESLKLAFEAAATRPGRVALVLPDNLAKTSLLTLPEWPPSRKQLVEIIRFKMRRAVPFKLDDASLAYQVLPGEGKSISVFVAVLQRALVERYENALDAIGARAGRVELCTPNLINLCQGRIEAAAADGDVALLNSAHNYFSLAIMRGPGLIFFRCKTFSLGDDEPPQVNGMLTREIASSLSYYKEKLGGQTIGTLLVRDVVDGPEAIVERLSGLAARHVEAIDVGQSIDMGSAPALTPEAAQQLAPAVGAAGR